MTDANPHDRAIELLEELKEITANMKHRPAVYGRGPSVGDLVAHHAESIRRMVELHRLEAST